MERKELASGLGSQPDRIPILAVIGGGKVAVFDFHRHLGAAELGVEALRHLDRMAARDQTIDRFLREIPLDRHAMVVVHHAPARRVARGLRVLAVVGDARGDLQMALRLHRAAHDAEAH